MTIDVRVDPRQIDEVSFFMAHQQKGRDAFWLAALVSAG
jgi:hypothetical protein